LTKKNIQNNIKYEIAGISMILASIFIYISLFSKNSGIVGEKVRVLILGVFGLGAYLVPVLIIVLGLALVYKKTEVQINIKFYSFFAFLLATLITLFIAGYTEVEGADSNWLDAVKYCYSLGTLGTLHAGGGAVGGFFGYAFIKLFGMIGTIAIIAALYIISILMFTEISALQILDYIKKSIRDIYARLKNRDRETAVTRELQKRNAPISQKDTGFLESDDEDRIKNIDKKIKILDFTKRFDKDFKNKEENETNEKVRNIAEAREHKEKSAGENKTAKSDAVISVTPVNNIHYANYKLPGTNLLSLPAENKANANNGKKEVMNNVKILQDTLKNFGVSATIAQVSVGPTITRYELQLSPGVKVSKILSLADDISLSLASPGIRIEAPIPGKAAIGIEVPNKDITSVLLREVIESEAFKKQKSKISFSVGKDVAGVNIVADLAKMPHLLIAGSTGSGKSICINSLIAVSYTHLTLPTTPYV
jgi:S-DNA-T family DNA segregation ATPase FtsK/SpoIIIE